MNGTANNGAECPEEFAWIHPGMLVDYRDRQMLLVTEYPEFLCNQWVVECQYTSDTYGHIACSDLSPYRDGLSVELRQAQQERDAARERVAELEGRVEFLEDVTNQAQAQMFVHVDRLTNLTEALRARLAALAPLVDSLQELHAAAASVSDGPWKLDESIKGITSESGLCDIGFNLARWDREWMVEAFNRLPTLLAGIAELQALVGEQTRTEEMKEQPQEEETPDRGCKHCGRPIYHDHEWLHKTGGESKDHRAEPNWTDWKGGGRYEQNR